MNNKLHRLHLNINSLDIFDQREMWCAENCRHAIYNKDRDEYMCRQNKQMCNGIALCPIGKDRVGRPIN